MKIEELKIESIKPYEKNPRKNDAAVDGVAESIKQFGFQQPIVIDSKGVIIAGHTRYKAAKKLGLETVPCVRAEQLTKEQVKAYRILDNKLNELSTWDFAFLGEELKEYDFNFEPFHISFPTFDFYNDVTQFDSLGAQSSVTSLNEESYLDEELSPDSKASFQIDLSLPFQWKGSKTRQRNNIYDIYKEIERSSYIEPFGGSGAMFFGKPVERNEVYNDINGLLCNFFRVLRNENELTQLKRLCDVTPQSRKFWHELRELCYAYLKSDTAKIQETKQICNLSNTSDEIATAFAFFYCQNCGFSGVFLSAYGTGIKEPSVAARRYRGKIDMLEKFSERFKTVNIENLDWRECLKKYDTESTLFYIDPPYECSNIDTYSTGWSTRETEQLVEAIIESKGKIVLSCYDCEPYQRLRQYGFQVKHFNARISVSGGCGQSAVETVYYRFSDDEMEKISHN